MRAQQPFQEEMVEITDGEWTEEVSLEMNGRTQWAVRSLGLYRNWRATVVKDIAHINFIALLSLHLSGNQIESVEILPNMQMPHIQQLYLGRNNITSVRVIRKAGWCGLQTLSIGNNYFRDGKSLTESNFPEIEGLDLYFKNRDKNKFMEQCFPFKMQATPIENLWVNRSRFSSDRSITRIIHQIFPFIHEE